MVFTLLTMEQIFGNGKKIFNGQLGIFKKYGTAASITDFAILLGGYVTAGFGTGGNHLKHRNGSYWSKTKDNSNARKVCSDGSDRWECVTMRNCGCRPALSPFSIREISLNVERGKNGLVEVEYGEYPQKACNKALQIILEKKYKSHSLQKSGKSYTVDSRKFFQYEKGFLGKEYEEYEYNGRKYVRIIANTDFGESGKFYLSNGEQYKDGDAVWVEVSPVKWLVDKKSKLMVAKDILFAGIQFSSDVYTGDFDDTNLGKYLKNVFSKDIIPSKIKSVKKEVLKKETNLTTEQEIIILEEEIESKFIKLEISGLFSDKVNNLRKEYEQIIGKIENNPMSIPVDGTDLSLNVEHIFTYKIQLQRLLDKVNDLINKLEMEISLSKENDSASLIKNYYKIKGELSLQEQEKIKDDLSETLYDRIKHEIISDNSSETFDILNDDFKTKIYILFLKEVKEYLKSVENKNSKFLLNILDREFTVDEIEQFLEITGQYLSVPKFNNNRK